MERVIVSMDDVQPLRNLLRELKELERTYGVITEGDVYDLYNQYFWAGIDIPFGSFKREITNLDKAKIEYIKSYSSIQPLGGAYIRFYGEKREPRTARII